MIKKKIYLLSLFLFSIIFINSVSAWGPTTHMYINDKMIPELVSSSIKDTIVNNRACFDAGFVATDVTVFYYFSTGMRSRYEATHSWSFQEEFMRQAETPCQQAFAYGIAAHLVQDSVSHNIFVPEMIRKYYAPNVPFHPIYELGPESWVIREHPEEFTRIQNSLNPLLKDPVLMAKFSNAISKMGVLDIEKDVKAFNEVLGNPEGFYTQAFNIPDVYKIFAYGDRTYGLVFLVSGVALMGLGIWKKKKSFLALPLIIFILPGVFFLIGGIAGITSIATFDKYMNINIQRSKEVFSPSGWQNRYKYDPTGFAELERASSEITWVWGLIVFAIVSLIILSIYLKVRKKK